MQSIFWKITGSTLCAAFLLCVLFAGPAYAEGNAPFQVENRVEKERVLDYGFQQVWQSALALFEEMKEDHLEALAARGLDAAQGFIRSDQRSGLLSLTITHKAKRGVFTNEKSRFCVYQLLITPVNKDETSIFSHEINFMSYDQYYFHGDQSGRYLVFGDMAGIILDRIEVQLKEGAGE